MGSIRFLPLLLAVGISFQVAHTLPTTPRTSCEPCPPGHYVVTECTDDVTTLCAPLENGETIQATTRPAGEQGGEPVVEPTIVVEPMKEEPKVETPTQAAFAEINNGGDAKTEAPLATTAEPPKENPIVSENHLTTESPKAPIVVAEPTTESQDMAAPKEVVAPAATTEQTPSGEKVEEENTTPVDSPPVPSFVKTEIVDLDLDPATTTGSPVVNDPVVVTTEEQPLFQAVKALPPVTEEPVTEEPAATSTTTAAAAVAVAVLAEETTESLPEDTTQTTPEETTQEVPQETTQEIPQETTQEIPQETTQETPQETTQEIPQETTQEIHQETTQEIPQETTQVIIPLDILDQTTQETLQETTQEIPPDTTQQMEEDTTTTEEIPRETTEEIIVLAAAVQGQEIPEETTPEIPRETTQENLQTEEPTTAMNTPEESTTEEDEGLVLGVKAPLEEHDGGEDVEVVEVSLRAEPENGTIEDGTNNESGTNETGTNETGTTEKIPTLAELEAQDPDKEDSDGSGEVAAKDGHEEDHHHDDHDDHDDHDGHDDHDDDHKPHASHHHDSHEDKEAKKRTAIIVGVAIGGVALFTLAFFTSRQCKKKGHLDVGGKASKSKMDDDTELVPMSVNHPSIFVDMEARNPNGLFRQGPKMGPPSPRMFRKNEGKFAFPESQNRKSLEVPSKQPLMGSQTSIEDDELEPSSPTAQLLPAGTNATNGRELQTFSSSPAKPKIVIQLEDDNDKVKDDVEIATATSEGQGHSESNGDCAA